MLPFHYNFGIYRRNNFGQPCVWYARPYNGMSIEIFHGILGKTINREIINTERKPILEVASRTKAKEKIGYKHICELKDNVESPVEESLLDYLNTYLPYNRTTADGSLLPMLAKVYDNTNNKLFKKVDYYISQWKINGLRCFVSAEINNGDLFKPITLKFQSREGTYWNSLNNLENYLLSAIDNNLLNKMIEEHYVLDGELYLPGHTVNEINHFVKDSKCKENKFLQYWCYDIAIENTIQQERIDILQSMQPKHVKFFNNKIEHFNNDERFVILPSWEVYCDSNAAYNRNTAIAIGFEGLIMRNPISEYQYGKRNLSMIKYKKSTDGKFVIVDIYPEGIKRSNIPLFLLKNDVNDATFEVHIGGSQDYQSSFLHNKEQYIGKRLYVEYGERSGVNNLPFHVKSVRYIG